MALCSMESSARPVWHATVMVLLESAGTSAVGPRVDDGRRLEPVRRSVPLVVDADRWAGQVGRSAGRMAVVVGSGYCTEVLYGLLELELEHIEPERRIEAELVHLVLLELVMEHILDLVVLVACRLGVVLVLLVLQKLVMERILGVELLELVMKDSLGCGLLTVLQVLLGLQQLARVHIEAVEVLVVLQVLLGLQELAMGHNVAAEHCLELQKLTKRHIVAAELLMALLEVAMERSLGVGLLVVLLGFHKLVMEHILDFELLELPTKRTLDFGLLVVLLELVKAYSVTGELPELVPVRILGVELLVVHLAFLVLVMDHIVTAELLEVLLEQVMVYNVNAELLELETVRILDFELLWVHLVLLALLMEHIVAAELLEVVPMCILDSELLMDHLVLRDLVMGRILGYELPELVPVDILGYELLDLVKEHIVAAELLVVLPELATERILDFVLLLLVVPDIPAQLSAPNTSSADLDTQKWLVDMMEYPDELEAGLDTELVGIDMGLQVLLLHEVLVVLVVFLHTDSARG